MIKSTIKRSDSGQTWSFCDFLKMQGAFPDIFLPHSTNTTNADTQQAAGRLLGTHLIHDSEFLSPQNKTREVLKSSLFSASHPESRQLPAHQTPTCRLVRLTGAARPSSQPVSGMRLSWKIHSRLKGNRPARQTSLPHLT